MKKEIYDYMKQLEKTAVENDAFEVPEANELEKYDLTRKENFEKARKMSDLREKRENEVWEKIFEETAEKFDKSIGEVKEIHREIEISI